jgi:hypothetical protein
MYILFGLFINRLYNMIYYKTFLLIVGIAYLLKLMVN